MMTYRLMRKDYDYLAGCLVPIGDQMGMSKKELADMLRKKTRKFTEEEIERNFYRKDKQRHVGVSQAAHVSCN